MDSLGLITLKSFSKISETKKSDIKNTNVEKSYNVSIGKDSICGSYNSDLNLIELNECIIKMIETKSNEKLSHYKKIKEEEEYNIKKPQSKVERGKSLKLIHQSIENMKECDEQFLMKRYQSEIKAVLDDYTRIGVLKQHVTFGSKIRFNQQGESIDKRMVRFSIIKEFINIASRYVQLNIYNNITINNCSCGYNLSSIELVNVDGDMMTCPNCNTEFMGFGDNSSSLDNPSSNKKKNNNYDGKINFSKELARLQGRTKNTKFPPNLMDLLDEYFTKNNNPVGFDVRNDVNLLRKTSRDMMNAALKSLGLPKLYKDVNLICHLYWGWELINLEALEGKIMDVYDQIYTVFDKIKNDRSSSLNTQYTLWWILNVVGCNHPTSSFKLPKTPSILEYHEKKREEICLELGWSFSPINIF